MFRLNAVSEVTYVHPKDDINDKELQQSKYSGKTLQQARIIFFFPSLKEFEREYQALVKDVAIDVQHYALQLGVDVEFVEPVTDSLDMETFQAMLNVFSKHTSYLMCFLGDRYGKCILPKKIPLEKFQAIQAAFSEKSNELELFYQYYKRCEEMESTGYKLLNEPINSADRNTLTSILQQATEKISQNDNNEQQQQPEIPQNLFPSAAEQITQIALIQPNKVVFCLRNTNADMQSKNSTDAAKQVDMESEHKKIEALKKIVLLSEASIISLNMESDESTDDKSQFVGRKNNNYIKWFIKQVTDHLQNFVSTLSMPSMPSIEAYSLAKIENDVHVAFAERQLPKKWLVRENIDKMFDIWSNRSKGYFHILGNQTAGKTAFLCQLYAVLNKKGRYVIIRFINLTVGSEYAHELWHGICMTLCTLTGQDAEPLIKSYHLSSTLVILKSLLEKLNRPVFILIDDANMIKYGRVMSNLDQQFRKYLANLVLICTTDHPIAIRFMLQQPILFELPDFTSVDIMQYINLNINNTLNKQQMDEIQDITEANNNNIIIAQLLLKQITDGTNRPLVGGIDERFCHAENDSGVLFVRTFAQLLIVTPHGLTTLEILDALTMNDELNDEITPNSSLSLRLHSVIDKLGCLIVEFVYGNRLVYKWSHLFIINIARRRYLTTQKELIKAHGLIAHLFADVNNVHSICSLLPSSNEIPIFPRPLKQDDGTVNIRKVHNLWYHLLHTGNMDDLKNFALCHFEYVEACIRACGIFQLLSIYEECCMQVLHHDIQVLFQQVIFPSLNTIIRDRDQLAAELINRLQYTQAANSQFLNVMVEQAMSWVDRYHDRPLLVPLSCWIPPKKVERILSFTLPEWRSSYTILQPTYNHQHLLISGNESDIGLVYMYHITSQLLIRTFKGHERRVTSISVSCNGAFFATTSTDCTVRIWNFSIDKAVHVMKPHRGRVTCSLITSDCKYIITGGTDSCANVISVENWEVVQSFKDHHTGTIVSLALASNDEFLVTGSGEFVVIVWNLSTGELAVRLAGLMAPVSCITMTSNDAFVVVACKDETLKVFGTVSGQKLHELSGHDGKVVSMVAAYDDCQLFVATFAKIYVFDIHNGKLLDVLNCINRQPVTSLKITNDNYFLLSACGNRISIWNIQHQGHEINTKHGKGIITDVCMSPDEKSAACTTNDGVIALWDLEICQCICTMIQKRSVPVLHIKFSINSVYLLSGDAEGQINIWNSSNGKLRRIVSHHNKAIDSIFCFSDGFRILSVDQSSIVLIWNLFGADETFQADRILAFTGIQPPIILSPNNIHLIEYHPTSKKELRIWAIEDESVVMKAEICHNEEITCFNTSSKGTLLVTGSADLSLKLWQIDTGFLMQVLVGHEETVICCAIANDESIIISGAKDSQIIVWATSTGNTLFSMKTESPVSALVINADATVILSANSTGWIEAYSVEDGTLLSCFNAHGVVKKLVASMDCNRILLLLTDCSRLPILCLHNTPPNKLFGSREYKKSVDYSQGESKQSIKSDGRNSLRIGTTMETKNRTLSRANDYSGPYRKSTLQSDGKESAPLHSILKSSKSLIRNSPAAKVSLSEPMTNQFSSSMYCPTKSNLCTVQ